MGPPSASAHAVLWGRRPVASGPLAHFARASADHAKRRRPPKTVERWAPHIRTHVAVLRPRDRRLTMPTAFGPAAGAYPQTMAPAVEGDRPSAHGFSGVTAQTTRRKAQPARG